MNLTQQVSPLTLTSRFGSTFSLALSASMVLAGTAFTPAAHATKALAPQFIAAQSVVPSSNLSYPYRCAVDADGDVYISDTQNNRVVKEMLANDVYTESVVVSSGLATPYGVAVDSSGNVYVADNGHNRVLKEAPSGSSYTQTVVSSSALSYPTGVAVDSSGNLYIADTGHGRILKEVPSGSSYTETALTYASNFAQITGIAVDPSGNIYVSDIDDNAVYMETYSAGSYTPSTVPTSGLNYPYDLTVDSNGNLYIADFTNKRIVEETPSGGSYTQSVFPSYSLGGPLGIAVDGSGNLYMADTFGQAVLKFTLAGGDFGPLSVGSSSGPIYALFEFTGGIGGSDTAKIGTADVFTLGVKQQDFTDSGSGNCSTTTSYSAGDSCAVGVRFTPQYPGGRSGAVVLKDTTYHVTGTGYFKGSGTGPLVDFLEPEDFFEFDVIRVAGSFAPYDLTNPFAAAVDAGGNVYVVDYNNNTVYKETWSASGYTQSTVAGGLDNPEDVAVDGSGAVYIVDSGNNQILKETWSAGAWVQSAVATGLDFPTGIAVDAYGNVYFSSFSDNAVYELTFSNGVYSAPVSFSFAGLLQPRKIALDGSGNVYVADTGNSRVVMETWTGSGYTQTVLGSGMHYPYAVAVDAAGDVYVGDTINSRILKESLSGGVYTQTVLIPGPPAYGVAVDGAGNLYFPDPADATVFKIDFTQLHSLSFASTYVGVASSDSPQSFVVFNNGNAPLSISVPGAGTNPSVVTGFSLDNTTTCPVVASAGSAGSLATGAYCSYAVDFIPVATGFVRGGFSLTDNSLNVSGATQAFGLSGTGSKQTQAISFTAPASPVTYGVAPIALTASGGASGNPVVFSVLSGHGSITGGNDLTVTGPGTILVAANQAGNSAYLAAPQVTQTVVVQKLTQSITFAAPATPVEYGVAPVTLTATGGASGNPVTFTVTGSGYLVGNVLHLSGGTVVVTANQASNIDYAPATPVSHSITVTKAPLTVTAQDVSRVYGAANPAFPYKLTGFVNGDLAVHTVTGFPSLTTTATPASAVGPYSITAAAGTLASSNYSFVFVKGTLTVTLIGAAREPGFTPAAGIYKTAQSVTITDSTPNAVIYYTTNGDTPTAQSTKYTAAISVSATKTLKAIAIAPDYTNSTIAKAVYTIQ